MCYVKIFIHSNSICTIFFVGKFELKALKAPGECTIDRKCGLFVKELFPRQK